MARTHTWIVALGLSACSVQATSGSNAEDGAGRDAGGAASAGGSATAASGGTGAASGGSDTASGGPAGAGAAGAGGASGNVASGGAGGGSGDAGADPYCRPASKSGDAIVVPCATTIELSKDWGQPAPGGSHCNGGWSYTLDVARRELSWFKCLVGQSESDPWTLTTGTKDFSPSELAALLRSFSVLEVTTLLPCHTSEPTKTAYVSTITGTYAYEDDELACPYGAGVHMYVSNIDVAFDALDAYTK